jgi:hypothetical protein
MPYKIELTDGELSTLGWAVDRGYFPEATYRNMEPEEPGIDLMPDQSQVWLIPEWATWDILAHEQEDPDSLFACIGEPLLGKLLKLKEEIV